jgi:triosephosphate isomerase
MSNRRPLVGGNWKMNGDLGRCVELTECVVSALTASDVLDHVDVSIFPPFPYLQAVSHALKHHAVDLGGQDCSPHLDGAYTGQTSPLMLADLGALSVLVGHSERRHGLEESNHLIGEKLRAVSDAGLLGILCVGETKVERDTGNAHDVVEQQVREGLAGLDAAAAGVISIAYEPVWAIGTGETATRDDVQGAHRMVREVVGSMYDMELAEAVRIIYGGSVKVANAAELFACPDVDGGLIGGASLDASTFASICTAARETVVA